jgi:hypothetical protein
MDDNAQIPQPPVPSATPAATPAPTPTPPDPSNVAHVTVWIRDRFDEKTFNKAFSEHLSALAVKHGVSEYNLLYLLDAQDELSSWHSNRIYRAASSMKEKRPILLVLHNLGGSIEAGYLISKTCKRLAEGKFVVAVPRKAKSAATLLALGADEIHMGLMSELGPIDPQFGGLPALGMKNALEILSDLACKYPGASGMLSDYIQSKLDLRILGYFERINESAMQYAERLLDGKTLPDGSTARTLADHLVNHYKDHGFVIDQDESRDLLGAEIVKSGSKEYDFANAVFESVDFVKFVLDVVLTKDADVVGRTIRLFEKKTDA